MTVTDHREDLSTLFSRLTHWLNDPADRDALARIYADDAVIRSPKGEMRGIDEIEAHVRRSDAGEKSQHFSTDVLVEGDTVRANMLVHFYRPGEAPHRSAGLVYRMTATDTGAGPRIAEGEIELLWITS